MTHYITCEPHIGTCGFYPLNNTHKKKTNKHSLKNIPLKSPNNKHWGVLTHTCPPFPCYQGCIILAHTSESKLSNSPLLARGLCNPSKTCTTSFAKRNMLHLFACHFCQEVWCTGLQPLWHPFCQEVLHEAPSHSFGKRSSPGVIALLPQLNCLHFCQVVFLQLLLDVLQNFQVLGVVPVGGFHNQGKLPLATCVCCACDVCPTWFLAAFGHPELGPFFSRVCWCAGTPFWQGLLAFGFACCLCLCLFLGRPFHGSNKAQFLPQVGFLLLCLACLCSQRKLGSAVALAKVFPFGKELGSDGSPFGKGLSSCGSPFGKGLLEAGLAAADGSGVPNILGRPWLSTETSLVLTFSFFAGLWSSLGPSLSTRGEGSSLWTRGKAETSSRSGFFSISSTTSWIWRNSTVVSLLAQALRSPESLSLLMWNSTTFSLSTLKLTHVPPAHLLSLRLGSSMSWKIACLRFCPWISPVASSSTSPFIKGITLTRALGLQAWVLEMDS